MSNRKLLLIFSAISFHLFAVDYDWNQNVSGTWEWDTNSNWSPSSGHPSSSADRAFFGVNLVKPSATISLTSDAVGFLEFDGDNAFTIQSSGSGMLFGAGSLPQIRVSGTASHIISAPIALQSNSIIDIAADSSSTGTLLLSGGINCAGFSITKTGNGPLTLSGVNTYGITPGNTTITAGTLALTGAGQLSSTGAVIANGTFDISAITDDSTQIGDLSGSGTVILGNKTLQLEAAVTSTFSGVIKDNDLGGSLILNSSGGTLTLSGVNNYGAGTTIGTTITAGTLSLSGNGTLKASCPVVVNDTFNISAITPLTTTIGNLNGNGSVVLGNKGLVLSGTAASLFGGTIVGSGGSIKLESNSLTLTNANNTYTGGTTITLGTLALSGSGQLSPTGPVIANGTFDISDIIGDSTQIGDLSGSGTVFLGLKKLVLGTANGATNITTFSGVIDDQNEGGSIEYAGTGTLTLSKANTYIGSTTIDAGGFLKAGIAGAFAPNSDVSLSGTLNLNNFANTIKSLSGIGSVLTGGTTGGILTISNGGSFSGAITELGGVTLNGGTLVLSGTNTYLGRTTLNNAGILQADGDNVFAPLSGVYMDSSAKLDLQTYDNKIFTLNDASPLTPNSATSIVGSGTLTISNGGTFTGKITDQVSLIIGSNQGTAESTLLLQPSSPGLNDYSGTTEVAPDFLLEAGGLNALSANSAMTVNGTLALQEANKISTLAGSGYVRMEGANILTILAGGSFNGSMDVGGMTLDGGTLILTSTGVTYIGPTTINSTAILQAGVSNAFPALSAFSLAGTLDLNDNGANAIKSLSGTGSVLTGGTTGGILTISNGGSFSGAITELGGLNLTGGTLVLSTTSGANAYSGSTTVASGGTLQAGHSGSFSAASAATVNGTLDLNDKGANAVKSLSGTGSVFTGGIVGGILTISNGGSFSGAITELGGLNLSGGTLVLSTTTGANTYSGLTTIANGATLQAGHSGSFSAASAVSIVGTLDLNDNGANAIKSLTGTGSVLTGGATGGVLTISNGGSFSGAITELGGLNLTGGALALSTTSGANAYSGSTTVASGATLQAGHSGSFSAASATTVKGTLDLNDQGVNAIKSLSGTGSVLTGDTVGGILTISNGSNGVPFSGAITELGGLNLAGGTLVLSTTSGANLYFGTTTIASSATLQSGYAGSFSRNSAVTVNGTLDLNDNGANAIKSLAGTGSVLTGGTTGGALTISNGGSFSGAITELGGLNLAGGTLVLSTTSGANTYSGATTVASGATLQAGHSGSFSAASAATVNGTLDLNDNGANAIKSLAGTGSVLTGGATGGVLTISNGGSFSGAISELGGLNLTGGTLSLSGLGNNYSGTTSITGGTLQAGAANTFSAVSAVTITNAGILNLAGYNNTILSLASASTTSQLILGAGTLTIAGGSPTTFAAKISDSPCGGLTIASGADLTLTNPNNSYCGVTTVDGALTINGSGALSPLTDVTVSSSGTFQSNAYVNQTLSFTSSGAFSNTGNATLGANNLQAIQVLIEAGTFTNTTNALFGGTGSNPAITVSGGTVTNGTSNGADVSVFGNSLTDLSLLGTGVITNNYQLQAKTYSQETGSTLNLTVSPIYQANLTATGNLNLAGDLVVTDVPTGTIPTSKSFTLLSTSGDGRVNNKFDSEAAVGFTGLNPRFSYSLQSVHLSFGDCDGTWLNPADGNWGNEANWDGGCVPGDGANINDVATFSTIVGGATQIAVTLQDELGTSAYPVKLLHLIFDASVNSYSINQFSAASTITFDKDNPDAAYPQIDVKLGSHTINAPMIITQDMELVLTDGAQMTFGSAATLNSSTTGNFIIMSNVSSSLGTGLLVNNATLTPYSILIDSGSVTNQGNITPTGQMTIGGQGPTYIVNSYAGARIGTTGVNGHLTIGGTGPTSIINDGAGSVFGPSGNMGNFLVTGSVGAIILNSGSGTTMGPTGLGGSVVVSSGWILNSHGALFKAGTGGSFTISGGTIINDLTSTIGSTGQSMVFSSGNLITSGDVFALNYTQSGTSTLQLNLTSYPSVIGSVQASGFASVGSNIVVDGHLVTNMVPGQTVNLIVGQKGVIGTFSSAQFLNFPSGFIPALYYTPTAVQLTLASTVTSNAAGSLPQLPFILANENNLRIGRFTNQLHSAIMGKKATEKKLVTNTAVTIQSVQDDLLAANDSGFVAVNKNVKNKQNQLYQSVAAQPEEKNRPSRFYIGPTDSFGKLESRGVSQAGFNYNSVGFMTGYDHVFKNCGLGVALEYNHTHGKVNHDAGSFHMNQLHVSTYGTFVLTGCEELAIDAIAGYGYDWYDTSRHAGSSLAPVVANGSPNGMGYDFLLGAEYIFSSNKYDAFPEGLSLTPNANLQYMGTHIGSYQEKDAGVYGLNVNKQRANSLRSNLGARLDYLVVGKSVTFKPEFDLAWQYEYLDSDRTVGFSTLGLTPVQTISQNVSGAGRNTLLIGFDFLVTVQKVFEFEASYDFQLNSLYRNHSFYIGLGGHF